MVAQLHAHHLKTKLCSVESFLRRNTANAAYPRKGESATFGGGLSATDPAFVLRPASYESVAALSCCATTVMACCRQNSAIRASRSEANRTWKFEPLLCHVAELQPTSHWADPALC